MDYTPRRYAGTLHSKSYRGIMPATMQRISPEVILCTVGTSLLGNLTKPLLPSTTPILLKLYAVSSLYRQGSSLASVCTRTTLPPCCKPTRSKTPPCLKTFPRTCSRATLLRSRKSSGRSALVLPGTRGREPGPSRTQSEYDPPIAHEECEE